MTYTCQYCKSSFKRIQTFQVHACEKMRRHKQKDDYGVRLGFDAWVKFYQRNVPQAKDLSYAKFVDNPYYIAFVKFGNYLESVNCFAPEKAIDWYLSGDLKIDSWTKDSNYDKWIKEFVKKEDADSGIKRTIEYTQKWSESTGGAFNHYFKYENPNRLCYAINSGKISPWVIFNCDSGIEFLSSLNDEQTAMIINIIDPDHWNGVFSRHQSDVEFVKSILEQAGFNV